jgi:hypothetical protein
MCYTSYERAHSSYLNFHTTFAHNAAHPPRRALAHLFYLSQALLAIYDANLRGTRHEDNRADENACCVFTSCPQQACIANNDEGISMALATEQALVRTVSRIPMHAAPFTGTLDDSSRVRVKHSVLKLDVGSGTA